jgi:molecular chaperone GrpE
MSHRNKNHNPPANTEPPEPPPAAELPAPVAAPEAALEEERLQKELAALQDRHLRLQAEFENFRKRQQRDREEANRLAKERILVEVAGVLDNLERALGHASSAEAPPESLTQGVELVVRQIREVLARFGAVPIAARGEPFDPRLHEAMARVDTSGDPPDGTVVEEYRRGYLLDGKVLRPAMVAVAKQIDEDGDRAL